MTFLTNLICVAFAVFAVHVPMQTQAQQLQTFGTKAKVLVIDDTGLSAEQTKELRSFTKKRSYFGAFAASPSTGRWDAETGFSSQAKVQEFVRGKCNILGGTSDCKIVAVSIPAALPVSSTNATGLSLAQSEYFEKTYLKNTRRYPRDYAAFAVNGFFAVARWGRRHEARAVSDALADCRRYGARFKGQDTAEVYKLRVKLGLLECSVIDVRRHKDRN
ncbi:hypothetical protein [Ascidiaceihabitans sp.]|uniref:hypothetical protein n=1 Tax=Ascidiaceihabitans sp. TaxID=1872644 RepID=UPI003296B2A8